MANRDALRAFQSRLASRLQAARTTGVAATWLAVEAGEGKDLFPLGHAGEIFPWTPPQPVPYTELINPVLTPLSQDMEEDWEGCLSVPGLRGVVPRYANLRYEGRDPQGRLIKRDVSGFHARVVQHETDHLMGILYPMRIKDFSRFGFTEVMFPHLDPKADD